MWDRRRWDIYVLDGGLDLKITEWQSLNVFFKYSGMDICGLIRKINE